MKLKYSVWSLALIAVTSLTASADEFDKQSKEQTLEKTYAAMHRVDAPYELGKSTFKVSVGCKDSDQDATDAIEAKIADIKAEIETAAKELELGEQSETWGYDLDDAVSHQKQQPISVVLNDDETNFVFKNACTGQTSLKPVRVKSKVTASKTFTVWFPNQGEILNSLTLLVQNIEKLDEKGETDSVKVECTSKTGGNYDLGVTKATEKAAYAEIEKVAKARALKAKEVDFAKSSYTQAWERSLAQPFKRGQVTRLPPVSVKKVGENWVGTFSDYKQFTVFYKQASEAETESGLLVGHRGYDVRASSSATDGLYGTLQITISQSCLDTKNDAESKVAAVGNVIKAKLQKINKGQDSESDRLKLRDAFATRYNALVPFNQILGDKTVNHYYNGCNIEEVFAQTKPKPVYRWTGTQNFTISSSNLDALVSLKEELAETYKTEELDVQKLTVSVSPSYSAKLEVLEQAKADLESQMLEKFLERGSQFQCDASNFSFACLSSAPAPYEADDQQDFGGFARAERAMVRSPQAKGGAGYTDGAPSDISAQERGVQTFQGKYILKYTVRKVLVDNARK